MQPDQGYVYIISIKTALLSSSEICLVLPDFAQALTKPLVRQHKNIMIMWSFKDCKKHVTEEQAKKPTVSLLIKI